MRSRSGVWLAAALLVAVTGCAATPVDGARLPESTALEVRLDALDVAVSDWTHASSVEAAHVAAETARNLVVGPAGPLYGDGDGDGTTAGANDQGLLPGVDGTPGLVTEPAVNPCVARDVLGGEWDRPQARWDELIAAIDAWTPGSNTFPSLPSHPQRVAGWATLTLAADDLEAALEYAGHARLHVDVTRAAVEGCDS